MELDQLLRKAAGIPEDWESVQWPDGRTAQGSWYRVDGYKWEKPDSPHGKKAGQFVVKQSRGHRVFLSRASAST